ncbi:hypothetical protein QYE76_051553 [Lolium multiflorum]|uniref:DUF4216 domain-containing protein n=1 Tax=Lolium multiflorum TaxID=4521 RepID=A0AAD8ST00_LOLMU|nr:hypothetical protein QYE76_051553 [Lolium multiflorum]
MADATTLYYANDVPTKHNPVARYNADEPKRDPKLLLFQYPGGKAGASKVENISPEEKDCIMLYVLMNMVEVVDFASQFHDEMWSGRNGPTPTQWYTLLKEGAPPLNKSFVNWFHEKGADPNVEMTDELRCVSQGFNRRVHTHEKYDVNGYRFHTEFHQKNRPNAKTINTGVYTGGADAIDYYGRLKKVYELTFNNTNIELKLFVFKCHWFDPHGGMRSTPSIGLVEVRPSTTYSGADVYIVAHQAKQVYYLSYPCQNEELMGWEVVFQVSPHGKLPIPSDDDYNNIDPVTYEGIFYQEEEQFGDLQIDIGLQDLHNDVQMRGETVVDPKDIAMLTKRHANKDNIVETQPEPNADPEYSHDTDSDSEAENPMPRDESGDECGSQGRVLPDGVEDPLFPTRVTKTQTEDGEDEGVDEGVDELEDEGEDELEDEGRTRGDAQLLLADIPSASGSVASQSRDEDEQTKEEEEETEVEEPRDEEASTEMAPKKLQIRGEAQVLNESKEPATDDEKWLLVPGKIDNFTYTGKNIRVPGSLIGAAIRKYWPGIYTPVLGGESKLAYSWEDYEIAPYPGFTSAADAVIKKFWRNYRVATEHKERADVILRAMCRKLTRQQWYNQRITCISHFYAEQGVRYAKPEIVQVLAPPMKIEDFKSVVPHWADNNKRAAFMELVRNWVGENPDFKAVSDRNKANRGHEGTHSAGSSSTDRYRERLAHLEEAYAAAYEEYLEKVQEHDLVKDAYFQWSSNQMATLTRFMMTGVREETQPEPPHPGPKPVFPSKEEFYCMYKRPHQLTPGLGESGNVSADGTPMHPGRCSPGASGAARHGSTSGGSRRGSTSPSTVEVLFPRFNSDKLRDYYPPGRSR